MMNNSMLSNPMKSSTVAGLIFNDGLILGADKITTNGDDRIQCLAPNIYICGAFQDTDAVIENVSYDLKLQRCHTDRKPRVTTVLNSLKNNLFSYDEQVQVSSSMVLGAVDDNGAHLYTINSDGSTDHSGYPYAAVGTGSFGAFAILQSEYSRNLHREEGIHLVHKAISSSNHFGGGNTVDICVITNYNVEYLRM